MKKHIHQLSGHLSVQLNVHLRTVKILAARYHMPTLQVRNLPHHLYQKIVERARAERRSIAQETICLLNKALEMEEQGKEHRQKIIDKILSEPPLQNGVEIPDPVLLIREDREE